MKFVIYQKCTPIHSSDVILIYAAKCLNALGIKDIKHRKLLSRLIDEFYLVLTYAEVLALKNIFVRYGSHDAVMLSAVLPPLISILDSIGRFDACVIKRVTDGSLVFYPVIRSVIQYIAVDLKFLLSTLRDVLSMDERPCTYSLRPDWNWVSEFVDKPIPFSRHSGYPLDGDDVSKLLIPFKLIKQLHADDSSLNVILHKIILLLSKYEDSPVLIMMQPSNRTDWAFALPDGRTL